MACIRLLHETSRPRNSEPPVNARGDDVLPPDVVVAGVGIGAAELVAGEHIKALAALELEAAAGREGEAVE